ncbi:hybrid sensor histidine kinase/response regulator [Cellulomonas sp. Leaf395]|uniref:hybrid sensor histidine kinase/response regulator n=1 Tax=Cellulomonas sp. Leaf395 TaxID=1736362 RepID=UPI0006F63A06|nr:GAF domain-containing protein [Cellulomonas sp. Leaf395]KQS97024.1 histidine kinase [Cellulomonas sp. Leaf395]
MAEHGTATDEAERERLRRARDDATDQFTAANAVLSALGRSAMDPDAVLDTIVDSACRLCRAQAAQVYLIDGDSFTLASSVGVTDELRSHLQAHPIRVDRDTMVGRAATDHSVQQIADAQEDPAYRRRDIQEIAGFRTVIAAPMLLDDEVVGALSLLRSDVNPFDASGSALLETFAAQAAVVVRHVHLLAALDTRGVELARRVDQLEALSEVGGLVSSSLVLDEVLSTIIKNAVRFSGCDGGSVMEYIEDDHSFSVRSAYASSPELLARLRGVRIELETTLVGRAARERHPIAVPDLDDVDLDPHLAVLHDDGWRSVLAVPVLRGERIIGALVVRRRTPGAFAPETVDFLETFAGQSALAVTNARLFRELEVKSAELEVVSQHKSEFLASMSHELRTPLNAVIGFSEVLLERLFGDLNERQEDYLRDILSSGQHLLELLNEILDLSKVEAGRMELEPSTFSVPAALDYGIAMVRGRAAVHGITITLDVDPALDMVESDELKFKQVLVNLLSNAVKFTPDGGHVFVGAHQVGRDVEVTVRDDGPGIAPEDRERIFEAFQQGRRGAPKEEGTGLGLTLCRRLVALLGGRIWLETETGAGSTFGFAVPAGSATPTATAPPVDAPLVLVVDDDRASLDLLAAYLDGLGVRVLQARDGRAGLDAVRSTRPAAVVLDIRLPGMDGWEVLEHLKADATTRDIPVVVASILDERARGLAMGASAYLVKPVGRDELVSALRRTGALPATLPTELRATSTEGAQR